MTFLLINDKNELKKYEKQILNLFELVYGKNLDKTLWEWFYLENPFGDAVVSLAFENNILAGHYAVIPYYLIREQEIKSYLSMTTMVHPDFRGRGLFIKQAKTVYEKLMDLGADCVFGFPNENSAHGFKKHLGWKFDEMDFIAKLTFEDLMNSNDLKNYLQRNELFRFPIKVEKYSDWRMKKPNYDYHIEGSNITKKFGNNYDIVFLNNFKDFEKKDNKIELLLDSSINDLKKFKKHDYQFGYLPVNKNFDKFEVKKDMILSDIF
jgi:GNAT superfamily N-acetyltransferase